MSFRTEILVAWGDCDPAGIVYYPNYFHWFDTIFQRWLLSRDLSQAILQQRYGILGTGILDTGAQFRATAQDGDTLAGLAEISDWKAKSFRVDYRLLRGDTLVAEGHETRGWLERRDGRVRAGVIPDGFRAALG